MFAFFKKILVSGIYEDPIGFSVNAGTDSVTVTIDNFTFNRNDLHSYYFEIRPYLENGQPTKYILDKGSRNARIGGLKPNMTYEIYGKGRGSDSNYCTTIHSIKFATMIPCIINQMSSEEINAIENKIKEIKNFKISSKIKSSSVNQVKIVCIGRPGSGKSSFYNTVHGIMKGVYKDYSSTGNSSGSFTKKVLMAPLENTEIEIIDTPGFATLNNQSFDYSSTNLATCIDYLMKGHLKEGYEHFTAINTSAKYYNGSPTLEDEIHAVAVFYDINSIFSSSDSRMMKELFEALVTKYEYKPLVILTHCDRYYKEQLGIEHQPNLKEVESNTLEKAANRFINEKANNIISRGDIKFMINYTCEFLTKPRDAYNEQHALNIIKILAERGELRILNRLKEIQSASVKSLPKQMKN